MLVLGSALILVVDDEAQNRRLLEALLKPEGYRTIGAASGEEALASIAREPPDLILLDVMMPGIDGYEVAARLKAASATSQIPIIMVTALLDRSARLAGLDAGAEEFLTKPVDRSELWLRVRNLLRLKALGNSQKQVEEEIRSLNAALEARVRQRTAELEASIEELEAFSYSVSHDLRAPLSSIGGFSTKLSEEITATQASERCQHYLGRIRAGVLHMNALIEGLLSLAQISRSSLHLVRVDLSQIAQTVIQGLSEREPNRKVQVDIQSGLCAYGDESLLRQLFENVLGNAWKFSGQQAQARIEVRSDIGPDGHPVYMVRDNGAGFDMAYASKLFSAFQRLHAASEFPGTGIGLATVQRIVRRHGGRVWAEAVSGQGATFHFTLAVPR